jgi:hypothetical protein
MSLALLLTSALVQGGPAPLPYPKVTDNRREVVNFNAEVVRGLAPHTDGSIYALNSHASQIVHHMNLTPEPERIIQTILNPVAIALWSNRILVVGGGTHALAIHDANTGEILNLVRLPAEPADIVVVPEQNAAYIACQGANVVVRVNLMSAAITHTYPINSERPRFLSLDRGPEGLVSADDRVMVTPFISGNGSGIGATGVQRALIGDSYLVDNPAAGFHGLPDQDLFAISLNPATAVAQPVARQMGTMLTAHGRHPNGKYWAFNVDSLNQNPATPNEPALRGKFVKNRAWFGDLVVPPVGTQPFRGTQSGTTIDLDLNAAGSYSPDGSTSVAFPWGIAFENVTGGRVFVCSPLNDCVEVLNSAGQKQSRLNLPPGSIPMDVEVDTVWGALLFVHCWGSNKMLVFGLSNLSAPPLTFDLGFDPTPAPIKRGRELWYDAHNSANGRTSCNSCHPGGKSDFLGWQISDDPTDRKDVMVTQSLLGIEDTFPYHWRGERALVDFNGAFKDLLGGQELSVGPGSQFEDFQAFVFSLQNPANPHQDIGRQIPQTADKFTRLVGTLPDGTVVPAGEEPFEVLEGNAQAGLDLFDNKRPGFNGQACGDCHIHGSGSNNDFINEVGSDIPSVQTLEVAHLRELTHKDQPGVIVTALPSNEYARGGFGLNHVGVAANIFSFIRLGGSFNLDAQEAAHVAAFVRRFDVGIAPAAHFGLRYTASAAQDNELATILVPQSFGVTRGIDLVAIGTFTPAGATQPVTARFVRRQIFNPTGEVDFLCSELAPSAIVTLTQLRNQTLAGQARLTFLGVPPGSGRRFALDPDNDDFTDFEERTLTPLPTFVWNPDSDNDGQPDGYEVKNTGGNPRNINVLATDNADPAFQFGQFDFASASMAKFHFEASEHVRVASALINGNPATANAVNPVFAKSHTYVVQGLRPSTPDILGTTPPVLATPTVNTGKIEIVDRAGRAAVFNFSQVALPMLVTVGTNESSVQLEVRDLQGSSTANGSELKVSIDGKVRQRFLPNSPVNAQVAQGRVPVFQVVTETLNPVTGLPSNIFVVDPSVTSAGATVVNQLTVRDSNGTQRVLLASELGNRFVVGSPTNAQGAFSLDAKVSGLTTGQRVRVRLIGVFNTVPGFPGVFEAETIGRINLPAMRPDDRGLEFTF